MTADLHSTALAVVTEHADGQPIPAGHTTFRVFATRDVRNAMNCGLVEARDAVDWAIEQVRATNLDQHRVPNTYGGWRYEFPNGHDASVINDPRRPFRFEVCSKALNVGGDTVGGLTSEQVEAKLHHIAALPAR